MKKLRIFSIIFFVLALVGFIIWRFIFPFSDWIVRILGTLMLVSIFTTVFSSVRVAKNNE